MKVEAVSLFLALLAIVAQVAVLTTVLVAVGGRFSSRLRRVGQALARSVGDQALTRAEGLGDGGCRPSRRRRRTPHRLPLLRRRGP